MSDDHLSATELAEKWYEACERLSSPQPRPRTPQEQYQAMLRLEEDKTRLRGLTRRLARLAEQQGLDATDYMILSGNIESASGAQWNAAAKLTAHLAAAAAADDRPPTE